MATIDEIRERIEQGDYVFTRHAADRAILRHIRVSEVREAITTGEIIEEYAEDKYGPSCLVLGFTLTGRPLHMQIGYQTGVVLKLITVYKPDPGEWSDFKTRR